ncbi:homeobox-leucine zipper protein HAT5-like [Bidens hawaiensis]|uniref:homeobox-leucine zipper protein HAT5-like n=1 Tax=Bidens hawaiensis TaxID=980011 RepID=UPI00404B76D9
MESGRIFFGSNSSNMFFLGDAGDNYFRGTRMTFNTEESSKKRPFMSSFDDMMEEEYYDEQLMEKKRRLSPEQVHMLEMSFKEENKLEPERKTELAKKLGLQPRQVAVWFQNRRARWKTKTLERDYNRLKSCYDILTSDYESIVKETKKLKAEVVSLTDKLQSKETSAFGQAEDAAAMGSGGSAVVDDHEGPQLDNDQYPCEYEYVVTVDQSEEDDGSDDGLNRFGYTFESMDHEEGDALGWWVWS